VQERLEKLNRDETECLDSLKQCGDCDAEKSNATFDDAINMLKQSEESIKRSVSIDDFVVMDMAGTADMLSPSELIK
jgi:hypothetical protein